MAEVIKLRFLRLSRIIELSRWILNAITNVLTRQREIKHRKREGNVTTQTGLDGVVWP